jgi:hypothetical protein
MHNRKHPISVHQYRDMLLTVADSNKEAEDYHCYSKQLVEVLDSCGTVLILGYIPVGITTMTVPELMLLFPTVEHVTVSSNQLIREWKLPASA